MYTKCTSECLMWFISCYLWRPQTDKLCQNGFFSKLAHSTCRYTFVSFTPTKLMNKSLSKQVVYQFLLGSVFFWSDGWPTAPLANQHLMWSCPKKLDHDSPLENSKRNSWASTTRAAAVKFFLGSGMVEDREKCLALSNFEKWQITTLWQVCGPNHHVNMRKMMMMAQV